jgi:hypothetical protein
MVPNIRRLAWITLAVVVVAAGPLAILDYFLPHHAVLRVVGTQIKRVGVDGSNADAGKALRTRDVYYIQAEEVDSQKPRVFRNEDTGWGFPFYFKFNSADAQATAQSIANERGTALITYYGWRLQIFSAMPNLVNISRAPPDASVFPWFNVVFFILLIGGIAWLVWRIRGFGGSRA